MTIPTIEVPVLFPVLLKKIEVEKVPPNLIIFEFAEIVERKI
jgi:hypothetical protein